MKKDLWIYQRNVNLPFPSLKLLLSIWLAILTCSLTAQNAPLRYIAYPADSLQNITPDRFFQSTLALKAPNSFVVRDSITVSKNSLLLCFRQLYDGLEVINSRLYLTYRNGLLQRYTGFYLPIAPGFSTQAALSHAEAERIYRNHCSISDTVKAVFSIKKVIMENPDTAAWSGGNGALLCYRIAAVEGYYGATLYMDASSGAVIYRQNNYSAGNFITRYYGAQSVPNRFHTTSSNCYSNQYNLHSPANFPRFAVHDVLSYNLGTGSYFSCSPFYDSDNSWTLAEHPRNYAQDAYWGVYNTIHFFQSKYGWSGFNGYGHGIKDDVKFYVIVDVDNFQQMEHLRDNAVWYRSSPDGNDTWEDGPLMVTSYPYYYILVGQTQNCQPFTSIDIMAHEYAHGVDDFTSWLGEYTDPNPEIYALAEGLSDIWGAVVEHEYAPSASGQDEWTIGEKPMSGGYNGKYYLRNMAYPEDPNAEMYMVREYREPDWYGKIIEANSSNDYNKYALSGVLSYWFYLLVHGDGCTVNGIGWEKAAKIVFNTQRYGRWINNYTHGEHEGFEGFAWATRDIVRDLLGMNVVSDLPADPNFTPSDLEELIKAWAVVKINVGNSNGESGSEINGNVLWDHSKLITSTVTVNPGATLTITGIIHFKEEAALVIKPGGKVAVQGGTLTNDCNSNKMWPGITVLGNSHLPQTDIDHQGQLYIHNGATVEHAICAIRNHKLNGNTIDYTTTGGNISAQNSRFINNAKMASLAPYTRSGSISTLFYNCTFEITPAYNFDEPPFENMIRLQGLSMVYFTGCDFKYPLVSELTTPDGGYFLLAGWRGSAIYAFNTQLTIQARNFSPYCLSCENYDRSTFSGFDVAVKAYYSGTASGLKIDRTDFVNIYSRGVSTYAMPNLQVTKSLFDVSCDQHRPLTHPGLENIGLFMADIPMFTIEENTFLASQSSPISQTGLLMQDSYTANQTVYRNSFIGLDCGEKFSGYNNYDGYNYGTRGVLPVCNTHTDNSIDIGVYSIHSDPDNEGVSRGLYLQGPTYLQPISLGNTFSSGTSIYSNTVFPTTYWANMQNPAEIPANSFSTVHGNVYVYQGLPHACLSRYGSDVIVSQDPLYPHAMLELGLIENRNINLNNNSTLAQVYTYYKGEYNNMRYLYNQRMDGGNTEALLDAVQGEWSDDVWKMRQELMRQAPFVSEEVLRKIAEQNLLPQALLLEICLANPDATKNPDFIYFLQYKIKNPMPAYMINLIKSKWDEKTLRTIMEEGLAAQSFKRDFYCNRMIGNLMHDSTAKPSALRTLLLSRGTLNDYFLATESYLQEGNFDGAFNTIYDYTQLHPKLDEATLAEIEDYLEYLTWLEKLAQSGQNIYQLKENGSDIATLAEYERTSTGRGRVLAHNILCGLYDICLEELPEKSRAMASGGAHGGATSTSSPSAGKVQVFPNPAKEYASFIWDFGSFDGTAQLSITDQSGRPLLTRPLPGAQGQWIWETGSVPSGSYVYSVIANGLQIESGKIVVTK